MARGHLLQQGINVPVAGLLVVAVRQEDDVGTDSRQVIHEDLRIGGRVVRLPLRVLG